MASTHYPSCLDINSDARSNFFASPRTPSASSPYFRTSTPDRLSHSVSYSNSQSASNTSRKRSRNDYQVEESTPYVLSSKSAVSRYDSVSPAPLVSTRYRLAGGLDTPTAAAAQASGWDNATPDLMLRRGRQYNSNVKNSHAEEGGDYFQQNIRRERNGSARIQASQPQGWGNTMFEIAGKVWGFCTESFRGFYAGGGQGYALSPSSHLPQEKNTSGENSSMWLDIDHSTNLPGGYPQSASNDNSPSNARASKKAKISQQDAELRSSWVLVSTPDFEPTPSRRTSTFSPTNASSANMRRPPPRTLATSTPVAPLRRAVAPVANPSSRPASAAGLRSPHRHTRTPSHNPSPHMLPSRSQSRRSSLTNPVYPCLLSGQSKVSGGGDVQPDSPIAQETKKFVEDVRRRDEKEERELRRFNRRLKDMIREGKEALGSRVSVEYEDEDEDESDESGDMRF